MKFFFTITMSYLSCMNLMAQKSFQYHALIGSNFNTLLFTSADGKNTDYATTSNSDIRVGCTIKNKSSDNISLSLLAGIINIKAKSLLPINSVELSTLNFDLAANYNLKNNIIQNISIGPALAILTYSMQENSNESLVNEGFSNIHIGMYGAIDFASISKNSISANPYLFYRRTLSNIEGTDAASEKTGYTTIGFGLKITI